jgi:hypothetical protein
MGAETVMARQLALRAGDLAPGSSRPTSPVLPAIEAWLVNFARHRGGMTTVRRLI